MKILRPRYPFSLYPTHLFPSSLFLHYQIPVTRIDASALENEETDSLRARMKNLRSSRYVHLPSCTLPRNQ